MDASAGADKSGNGHAVPFANPDSLPSAVVVPPSEKGAPVSSAPTTAAPAAGAPDEVRDPVTGKIRPGKSLNPKGRAPGTPNLNNELLKAIKKFRLGQKSFLELFLTRSLQDVEYAKLIAPKVFGNVDQPMAPGGISIHNNPQSHANHSETHVNVAKLLADSAGRDGIALFAERLAACGAVPGESRNVRQ